MKMLNKLVSLTLFVAMVFSLGSMVFTTEASAGENLINNISSNNWGMYAVPKLGEINVDATFDDWDWSPRIMLFPDYSAISSMSAEACVNYDEDNLYLGFIVKDSTPLNNTVDPELEYSITWRGDCFQLRFIGDHIVWATFAYHKLTDRYSMLLDDMDSTAKNTIHSIMYLTEPGSTKFTTIKEVGKNPRQVKVSGMEMCAKVDTQVSDSTANYELKFPKSAIFYDTSVPYKAGDIIQMGIECYWSNDTGRAIATDYKDNLQSGSTERDFFWTAYKAWGNVTLLDTNNIEQRQYKQDVESPLKGYFKVNLEVPKDAKFITVTIDDNEGIRLRNLVAELEVEPYVIEERAKTKIVQVLWDGRDNTGEKVSPGTYYFNGITYGDIAPIYDYHFFAPGEVPWNNADTAAGWICDHYPPQAAFAYDDMVYLGGQFAEGGHGLIAYDPKTESKKWGITYGAKVVTACDKYIYAQPGWTFTFSSSIKGNKFIGRYNRVDGTYNPFTIHGETVKVEYGNDLLLGILNGQSTPSVTGLAANDEIIAVATNEDAYTDIPNNGLYNPTNVSRYKNYISGINLMRHDDVYVYKRIYVEDIGEICFSKDYKHLYAVSGNKIVDVNINSGEVTPVNLKLSEGTVIGSLTTDIDGNILIFDKGADSQIKVYNPKTGVLVNTMGIKGGRPYDGDWVADGLVKEVSAITSGYEGRTWAVECIENPRRITEWAKDGSLMRELVGNTQYSCNGAFVDDNNPNYAYYKAARMKIDIENNTYTMDKVLYIPDIEKHELFPMEGGQDNGQYFSSDASGEMRNYSFANCTLYVEGDDGRYRPCFRAGTIGDFFEIGTGSNNYSNDNVTYGPSRYQNYDLSKADEYAAYWANVFSGCNASDEYVWNDYNMDGIVQREECTIYSKYPDILANYKRTYVDANGNTQTATTQYYENAYHRNTVESWRNTISGKQVPNQRYWSQRMTNDTMQWSGYLNSRIAVWSPARFLENGAPVYTMEDSVKFLEVGSRMADDSILTEGDNKILVCPTDGKNDYYANSIRCYDRNTGKMIWNYRNDYPGVHGSHSAGMQEPYGVIIGPLKMLGTFHTDKDDYIVIRGNQGCDYVMTTDGYYVSTFFKDNRLTALALPKDLKPGHNMNEFTEGPEPFGGNGSTHTDGVSRYVISTGGRVAIVVRIEGMETIEHFKTVPFKVTLKDLEACYAYVEEKADDGGVTIDDVKEYEIKYAAKGFNLDGASDDWAGYPKMHAESAGTTEYADARLAWNEENLYAIYEVRDDSPMINGSPDFMRLFKFGDVCDVNLSPSNNANTEIADDDLRIMLSVFQDKPVAVLFKQKDPLNSSNTAMEFTSPVMSVKYNTIKILDSAEVVINRTDSGYILEAKIPWSSINVPTPSETTKMRGDIGIVTSDEFGSKNLARIYFFNKDTGLTSDIPNEAKCYPDKWGGITFSKDDPSVQYWEMFGDNQ